jgi:hypothetical protein
MHRSTVFVPCRPARRTPVDARLPILGSGGWLSDFLDRITQVIPWARSQARFAFEE